MYSSPRTSVTSLYNINGGYENDGCRVGIHLPTVEVRFEKLSVDALTYVGTRALPTLGNFAANIFEVYTYIYVCFFIITNLMMFLFF